MTRNCAVKKSLCGTARLSRVSSASDAAPADGGFSDAEVDAAVADLAREKSHCNFYSKISSWHTAVFMT